MLVTEAEKIFYDSTSDHLIGTLAVGPLPVSDILIPGKVLKNMAADGGIRVNDGVYGGIRGVCFCHFSRIL